MTYGDILVEYTILCGKCDFHAVPLGIKSMAQAKAKATEMCFVFIKRYGWVCSKCKIACEE